MARSSASGTWETCKAASPPSRGRASPKAARSSGTSTLFLSPLPSPHPQTAAQMVPDLPRILRHREQLPLQGRGNPPPQRELHQRGAHRARHCAAPAACPHVRLARGEGHPADRRGCRQGRCHLLYRDGVGARSSLGGTVRFGVEHRGSLEVTQEIVELLVSWCALALLSTHLSSQGPVKGGLGRVHSR